MTIATDRGFKIGNIYTVNRAGHHMFKKGDELKFTRDDDTDCPGFTRVSDGAEEFCMLTRFDANEPQELEETPVAEPVAVHINLNGNSTTIVVQRNLTADEVAVVLKAINAA